MSNNLVSALDLGSKEHIAIVGGGGKTTLMFGLAEELRHTGHRVVTGTTTKVWQTEALRSPRVVLSLFDSAWHEKVKDGLFELGHVFVAENLLESGKVQGITGEQADGLYNSDYVDYLVLEADGAAGRPIKAPGDHEPVIPSSVSMVVAMMGLEAIGKTVGPEVVFRPERFESLTGLEPGDKLMPTGLARIFKASEGLFKGTPSSARRVVFLNKLDLVPGDQQAKDLADLLLMPGGGPIDRVIIGSIPKKRFICYKNSIRR